MLHTQNIPQCIILSYSVKANEKNGERDFNIERSTKNLICFPIGDVFSQSEMAKTLSEITKIDPQFNKDNFLQECEFEIIPAVLEVTRNYTQYMPVFLLFHVIILMYCLCFLGIPKRKS